MEQTNAVGLPYNQHAKGCSYRENPEDCDCECPPVPEPKFCKDCKWIVLDKDSGLRYARCGHEKATLDSPDYLVDGETRNFYCSSERMGWCGPEGKLWEAK